MIDDPIYPCQHIHEPSHMKGWEAFGVVDGSDPLVRTLGHWGGKNFPTRPQWIEGTEPWGSGETKRGVAHIEIHMSADSTDGYVYAYGTTEKGVTDAWYRTAKAYRALHSQAWGKSS